MAALIQTIAPPQRRAVSSFDDWAQLWSLDSLPMLLQTTMGRQEETSDGSFLGLVAGAYLRNPVVAACLSLRARIFSEARFQFQQMRTGQPGALFGTPDLSVLEEPSPGETTRDLLQLAILRADLAGAAFLLEVPGRIHDLRPDWTTVAWGVKGQKHDLGMWHPQAERIGYGYYPGGTGSSATPFTYLPNEVAFFAPTKNPVTGSGISIITAALREVLSDNAATTHKRQFFEAAATPNLALKFPATMSREKALEWIELFEQEHRGALNAWKTIYLGSGVEPTPVGLNFQEMDYSKLQGKVETRIASLTGMHPVVAALSEGLEGSALNSGNFKTAARSVATTTLHPLWGDIAGSVQRIVPAPPGSRLWYDDRHIPFLREDVKDQAEITQKNAATIGQLVKDGFTAASAIEAVITGDMNRLVHTGLVSVQLQPPGTVVGATREFWPVDGTLSGLRVQRGQQFPGDHPVVSTFPSLFEPVALLSTGEGPPSAPRIVAGEDVMAARERLRAAGQSHGYDSIARELNVSRDTVRRLMGARS